jgi:hypothetical protein
MKHFSGMVNYIIAAITHFPYILKRPVFWGIQEILEISEVYLVLLCYNTEKLLL